MTSEPSHAIPPRGFLPAIATIGLLAIPFVAMQFTDEVRWQLPDFVLMGTLLFGTGLAFELLLRRGGPILHRVTMGLALFSTLLMTWANLAVGLIGGEGNPVNALLLLVPCVGMVGATLARLRPGGMSLTLAAMAATHAALAILAWSEGWRPLRRGPIDIWAPNGLFVLLFVVAAALFLVPERSNRSGGE